MFFHNKFFLDRMRTNKKIHVLLYLLLNGKKMSKITHELNLTEKQQQEICLIVDEWYLIYKDQINKTDCFGYVKEVLKMMIKGNGYDKK